MKVNRRVKIDIMITYDKSSTEIKSKEKYKNRIYSLLNNTKIHFISQKEFQKKIDNFKCKPNIFN